MACGGGEISLLAREYCLANNDFGVSSQRCRHTHTHTHTAPAVAIGAPTEKLQIKTKKPKRRQEQNTGNLRREGGRYGDPFVNWIK